MSNEMIPIDETKALVAFSEKDGLQSIIDDMKAKVEVFEHDMTTAKGRDRTRSLAYSISTRKTRLDKLGKGLNEEKQKQINAVNANRKSMRDQLDDLNKTTRQPLTNWEEVETERVINIEKRIGNIKLFSMKTDMDGNKYTLEELRATLKALESMPIDGTFEEFVNEAAVAKDQSVRELRATIDELDTHEKEQAELKRLREEKAAREKKDYEDKLKAEAVAQAIKDADEKAQAELDRVEQEKQDALDRIEEAKREAQQAKDDAAQAERDKIAAVERAKVEKEQAVENARLAEVKRQKDEADRVKADKERREANEKHVDVVMKTSILAITQLGVTPNQAKEIVEAIKAGKIPNVTINF